MPNNHIAASGAKAGQWVACKAKVQCRNDSVHIDSVTLKAMSKYVHEKTGYKVNALSLPVGVVEKLRGRVGAMDIREAMIARADIQSEILTKMSDPDRDRDYIRELCSQRDAIEDIIRSYSRPLTDDGCLTDEAETLDVTLDIPSHRHDSGIRKGFLTLGHGSDEKRDRTLALTRAVSERWLRLCSSSQAQAIRKYSDGDSHDYAVQQASGEPLDHRWQELEEVVAKTPRIRPYVSYTGVNEHYVASMLKQAQTGTVTFDRVFSSTLDAGRVNSFATGEEKLVIEVETDSGAFMDLTSGNAAELEVLLPKGKYDVVGYQNGVKYEWGDGEHGQTIEHVLQLRQRRVSYEV